MGYLVNLLLPLLVTTGSASLPRPMQDKFWELGNTSPDKISMALRLSPEITQSPSSHDAVCKG